MTPFPGGLLGDKLTTIPSQTVGRAIRDSRQGLDYAKHIFDVDRLARGDVQPGRVREAFEVSVNNQNRLRGTDFGLDDVVSDLVSTCQAIVTILNPKGWSPVRVPPFSHDLRYLQRVFRRGVRDLRPFLAGGVIFGEEEFVTAAGDAALIALSTPSEADTERTVSEIGEGKFSNREVDESMEILGGADAERGWFLDLEEGLYSQGTLGTWSEVVRRLNEE